MTKIDVSDRRRIPKHGAVTQVGGWRPRRRRWVRGLAAGFVGVLVLTFSLYGWAWSSVDHSSIARAMWWMEADVDDQYRFPARAIRAGGGASSLPAGDEIALPYFPAVWAEAPVSMRSCTRRAPSRSSSSTRTGWPTNGTSTVRPHDAPDLVLGREVVRVHARGHRHRRGLIGGVADRVTNTSPN